VSSVFEALNRWHQQGKQCLTSSAAITWLPKMGFKWSEVQKGIYFDGHKSKETVEYREQVFFPKWFECVKRMPEWNQDGSFTVPVWGFGEKLIIPVAHNEATYCANDGIHQRWVHKIRKMIRKK
jgi:hypothetical protein